MNNYKPPLSVVFVWHPNDTEMVNPIIKHCYSLLSRDMNNPFSRSMNLPIYFRNFIDLNNGIPREINTASKKTIVFIFLSKEFSDELWMAYITKLSNQNNIQLIPIAIEKSAINFSSLFKKINFIRAFDYNQEYINDYLFIAITHEIYRYTLNKDFDKNSTGKDNSIKLFLSHAKHNDNSVNLAKGLKEFIDNSTMSNFFDTVDIAPGYAFDDEIIKNIQESTVIAIHSDNYSSRYWCQREILCAKANDRPIIEVDILEEFEDRIFPFLSNVPSVHAQMADETEESSKLRILSSALLETVRFNYAEILLEEYKRVGMIDSDALIRSRPPDISDIEKILYYDDGKIKYKYKQIVYPEPPVYGEEISVIKTLGVETNTPITLESYNLREKNIGISISEPSDEELSEIGIRDVHINQLSQDIARHLLARNSTIIYGGDFRADGFTQIILDEALVLKSRLKTKEINHVKNYISWPIYNNKTDYTKEWITNYMDVADRIKVECSDDVYDLIPNKDDFLPPNNPENSYVWSRCLTKMRKKMVAVCDVRICAGGRQFGYKGIMPGVLEEIVIAIKMGRPLFLLGGFGGVTASVCKLIQTKEIPEELTLEWQKKASPNYEGLLDYTMKRNPEYLVDYENIAEILLEANMNNGLSTDDNYRLFNTTYVDEALYLIFKGLGNLYCE